MEGQLGSFKVRAYSYNGKWISIDSSNSMLFEFSTLQAQFPNFYSSPTYKMLLSLGLYQQQSFELPLLNEIDKVRNKDNIDKVVLCSTVKFDTDIVQFLKTKEIDIINFDIPSIDDVCNKPICNFVPIQGQLEYSLLINHIAGFLIKRLKKLFHLILSEIAAPIYDEHYGKDKVATQAIMKFEELQLTKLLKRISDGGRNGIAVDVGCGTGRHSFILARIFSEVYAFDFSSKMIEKAQEKKRKFNDTRIIFSVNDFEYERLSDENKFYGTCDLVVASFGMGSFIEDTVKMLRRFYDWLKPGGYVFISFYNENSTILQLTPNWRDTSLSSNIDLETRSLKVTLPGGINFKIFCKSFNEGTKGEINKIFNVDTIYTYPTLMALLPNSLLQDKLAYRLFSHIDELLSDNKNYQYGHYVIVIAHKPEIPVKGYSNVIQTLQAIDNIKFEILSHSPVLSIEDVKREIGEQINPACMIKTIIFKVAKTNKYISVSIPSHKKVNKEKIARILNIPINQIKFAAEKEVLHIGFPLGGIAPFGFDEKYTVHKIIDAELKDLKDEWLYMGIGDNKKTLKIKREDFIGKIVRDYIWEKL